MTDTAIQHDPEVARLTARASGIEAQAAAIVIADETSAAAGAAFLGDVSLARKLADDRRKFFVAPLNDHVKTINGLFRPMLDAFAAAEGTVKAKIAGWRRVQAQRAEEERRKHEAEEAAQRARAAALAAEADDGWADDPEAARAESEQAAALARNAEIAAERAAAPVSKTIRTSAGGVTARRVWKFRLVNLSLVPREYLCLDERAVRAAVKAGVPSIPGIEMYEDEDITVRTTRR